MFSKWPECGIFQKKNIWWLYHSHKHLGILCNHSQVTASKRELPTVDGGRRGPSLENQTDVLAWK